MATNEINSTGSGNNQAIGTAVIVSGSVQVESADGATRVLQVNGLVFANETVITGGTGKVSIIFNDADQTQLDLGRMSEVVLDGDVYPGDQAVDLADVVSEVEQLQEAILQGDPTQDLPAPAAGPAAGGAGARGGGHPTVVFELTGEEVTPTSGAETIGISRSFLDPERLISEEELPVEAAAIIPPADEIEIIPENFFPEAGDYSSVVDEANFLDGTEPVGNPLTVNGNLTNMDIDFGGDGPGSITIGGQSIDIDNLGGNAVDSITVTGTYGTLELWDNGSWTYTITTNIDHPNADVTGAGDSLPDPFAFTVFDSNGDSATGTLTINILDDGPEASDLVLTRVVEEEALDNALSLGNPDESDGPEDSDFNSLYQNDAAQVNGTLAPLVTMGADNPGTFSWGSLLDLPGLSSQGGQVVYELNANGTTLEAWVHEGMPARIASDFDGGDGDRLVFTLDLQPDGNYIFTLLDQLDHVAGEGENTALLLWGEGSGSVDSLDLSTAIIATDSDDDSTGLAPGALSFLIVDDVPELSPMEEPLTVYEDGLDTAAGDLSDGIGGGATDVTINLAALVEDGADEDVSYTLLDNLSYQPSGLTSNDKQVSYSVTGNVLTAATVDNTVFTFTLDPLTGNAVFDLIDQLDHTGAGDDEILFINDLGQFVQVEDADGDTKDFSGLLSIQVENDVPELSPMEEPLTVYEDGLDTDAGDLSDGIGGGATDVTINLAALVEDGADEDVSYTLLDNLSYQPSGLTSNDKQVSYSVTGNVLTAATVDNTVFTFTLDPLTGNAVFDLIDQLDHTGAGDDEMLFINDLGQFVQVEDADGDTKDFSGLLSIQVENDVPELSPMEEPLTVYEDGLDTDAGDLSDGIGGGATDVTINLAALVEDGADEDVSYTLLDNLSYQPSGLTSNDKQVSYSVTGNVLTAATVDNTVFTFTLDPLTGNAVFDLIDQLDHTGAGDDEMLFINDLGQFVQVEDADGDTKDFSGLLSIQVENDVPELSPMEEPLTVYEDGLDTAAGDLSDGIGGGATDVTINLAALVEDGADEDVSYTLLDNLSYQPSGLTSNDKQVSYSVTGNVLTAATVDNTVFTFTLDPLTGNAVFDLIDQLDHTGAGDDEMLFINDLGQFVQVEDADGDTKDFSGLLSIQVENDVPELSPMEEPLTVYEDGLDTDAGDLSDGIGGGATDVTINLAALVEDGADEDVSYTLLDNLSYQPSGLTSNDKQVSYSVTGNVLTAATVDNTVFTFTLDPLTGNAVFDLIDQLDHTGAGDDEMLFINDLGQFVQVEDADGDTKDFSGLLSIQVENDVPELSPMEEPLTVYEDGLDTDAGDLSDGIGGGATDVTINLAALVEDGADEDVSYTLLDNLSYQPSGLTSNDKQVSYSVTGNVLTAATVDNTVFTFTLDPLTGNAVFDLIDQLDHTGAGDDEMLFINDLGQFVQVEDADGDTKDFSGLLSIQVENDVPELSPMEEPLTVYEDGLDTDAGDLSDGIGGGATDVTINLAALVEDGADEDVSYTLLDNLSYQPSGLTSNDKQVSYSVTGNVLTAATVDNTVFTFTLDPLTGNAVFDLIDQLDHTGAGDDEILFINDLGQFVQVEDADGDTKDFSGLLSIQVENDVPELSPMEEPLTVYEDGLDTDAGDLSDGIGGGATDVTINLAALVEDGADEDVSYTLLDNLSYQPSGLTSNDKQVSYSVTGNVLTAATVDNTVFTFTLDPLTGNAVFDLIDQLDHTGAGDDEMLFINDLGQFVQVEDADGDTKDFSGLLSIQVENDVPELSPMEEPLTVYEDGLDTDAGDLSDGIGGGATDVTINLAALVEDGADEDVSYTLLDNLSYQPSGLTSNDKQVSYSVTGNVLTAATVDNTVFTFTLDPLTGNAVFDLIDQLDHTGAGDDEMLFINDLGQFVQVEDADGDTKDFSGLLSIQVENDVPELSPMEEPLTVYEDGLDTDAGDLSDGIGGGATDVTINLAALVEDGADEDVSYTLLDNLSYQPSGLTSNDKQVSYSVTGNVLTAATVDNTVFTFTLDPLTGNAVFDLIDQLDHTGAGDDEMLFINDLGQFVQVEDADGDTKDFSGLLSIQVENDVPEIGEVSNAFIANEPGLVLAGTIDVAVGADELASADLSANVNGWNGTSVTSADSGLTNAAGETVYYYVDPSDTSILYAVTNPDDHLNSLVFTLTVDPNSDLYELETFDTLSGGGYTTIDLTETSYPGGPRPAYLITDQNNAYATQAEVPSDETVLLSVYTDPLADPNPGDSDDNLVQGSNIGLGIDDQWVEEYPQDTPLIIDFGVPGGSEVDTSGNIDIGVDIHGNKYVDIQYTVYDDTHTVLYSGTETLTGKADTLEIDGYNNVSSIEMTATDGAFRVNSISFGESVEGEDINETFRVDIYDADGDMATEYIDVEFDNNNEMIGTNDDDVFVGGQDAETIDGGDGNDLIFGGAGDDTLEGGEGNDILIGGTGEDELFGGEGDDTLFGGDDNDELHGDAGNDELVGGEGDDIMEGGDDDDTLFGGDETGTDGAGTDTLTGDDIGDSSDTGSDTFVDTGGDTVTDLDAGEGDDIDNLVPPPVEPIA